MRFYFVIVIITVFLSGLVEGHQGHDHDDHHEEQVELLPESDPEWSDPAVHTQGFKTFTLKWKDDPSDPKYALIKMTGRAVGYIAVGFCPVWQGTMAGCDIILGWVDRDQKGQLHDYIAPANTVPMLDPKQDVELVSSTQTFGITSIVFRRLWDTGDDENDANLIHNKDVHVIYAWSNTVPESPTNFLKHENYARGHTHRAVSIKEHNHSNANILGSNLFLIATIALYYLLTIGIFE